MGNGTSIGRVRGLGSARHGTGHWIAQRMTAIGNLALMLFFLVSLLLLPDYSYQSVSEWIARPVPAVAMALLVISLFWHARLGIQVFYEDYVHEDGNKFACAVATNLIAFAGTVFGLFCIVRLALGAHA